MLLPLEVDGPRMQRRRSGEGKEVVELDNCVIEEIRSVT